MFESIFRLAVVCFVWFFSVHFRFHYTSTSMQRTLWEHSCWRASFLSLIVLLPAAECTLYTYLVNRAYFIFMYTTTYIFSRLPAMTKGDKGPPANIYVWEYLETVRDTKHSLHPGSAGWTCRNRKCRNCSLYRKIRCIGVCCVEVDLYQAIL